MSRVTRNGKAFEVNCPGRDCPLSFHWQAVDDDWIKSLDLPASRRYADARASILLEALIANRAAPGQWISYSRRKEWWSNGTRYRGSSYTYATVPAAVEELAALACLRRFDPPFCNFHRAND